MRRRRIARVALTAVSGFFGLLFVGYAFANSARLSAAWDGNPSVVTPRDLLISFALLVPALAAFVLRELLAGRNILEILGNENSEAIAPEKSADN
jgi:hypothetical protein